VRALLLLLVVLLASCESEEERSRQQFIADKAACKDELAHHDSWSSTPLSERCQPIANLYAERKKRQAESDAQKQSDDLERSIEAKCDEKGRDKRYGWLTTKVTDDGWTSAPRDEGFRIDGTCGQKLSVQAPDCSDYAIATVYRGTPWIREAVRLGFTRFVCSEVDHLSENGSAIFKRVVEKPIASL
jgi:hypothetical protein